MKGLRWRIGDGTLVRVFHDPQLPMPWNFKLVTPLLSASYMKMQGSLTRLSEGNGAGVNVLFCSRDKEMIQSILLCSLDGVDRLVQHHTPSGSFTVLAAYKTGLQFKNSPRAGSSSSINPSAWSLLWRCNIPLKIQIFAWQLCNNALATGPNLKRIGITLTESCPRCTHTQESNLHIFSTVVQPKQIGIGRNSAPPACYQRPPLGYSYSSSLLISLVDSRSLWNVSSLVYGRYGTSK